MPPSPGQRRPKPPTRSKKGRKAKRSFGARLRRWAAGLLWWNRGTTAQARQRRLRRLLMGPKQPPTTFAQWRDQRQHTVRQAKLMLAANKPLRAIQLLTRAQLVDPEHLPYQSLLIKAIELREQRRGGKGRSGLLDRAEGSLRQQVLDLEAFIASVEELERLVQRAGFPPLKAPKAQAVPEARRQPQHGGDHKAVSKAVKGSKSAPRSARPDA